MTRTQLDGILRPQDRGTRNRFARHRLRHREPRRRCPLEQRSRNQERRKEQTQRKDSLEGHSERTHQHPENTNCAAHASRRGLKQHIHGILVGSTTAVNFRSHSGRARPAPSLPRTTPAGDEKTPLAVNAWRFETQKCGHSLLSQFYPIPSVRRA